MEEPKIKIKTVAIDSLEYDPFNVREHDERNIEAIKASLARFGQQKPIVVKKDGTVIAGNGTLGAMRMLGFKDVVIAETELEGEEAVAFAIADNRTAELANWDDQALAQALDQLDGDLLPASGFDDDDLAKLLKDLEPNGGEAPDAQTSRADELQEKWKVERGQLWQIGEHRLFCGDSTSAGDWLIAHGDSEIHAVVSDPPYGIGFEYDSHDDNREGWYNLMNSVIPIMKKTAEFVVIPACGIDRMGWWYANHSPEWILCWYKGSPGHRSPIGFNDWEAHLSWGRPHKQMHDYWQTHCGFNDADGHPCPKPVAYALWLVERAVDVGCAVFDPFLGSGTTMVASEQLNRKCYGIEIEPKYCAVILERMSDMGLTPKLTS